MLLANISVARKIYDHYPACALLRSAAPSSTLERGGGRGRGKGGRICAAAGGSMRKIETVAFTICWEGNTVFPLMFAVIPPLPLVLLHKYPRSDWWTATSSEDKMQAAFWEYIMRADEGGPVNQSRDVECALPCDSAPSACHLLSSPPSPRTLPQPPPAAPPAQLRVAGGRDQAARHRPRRVLQQGTQPHSAGGQQGMCGVTCKHNARK